MVPPIERGAKVLVTGLGGFTGRYVGAALSRRGLTAIDPQIEDERFDLTDPKSVRRAVAAIDADYVIHLAAISFVAHGDPIDFYRVNTIGTINLLEAIAAAGRPRKIVIASSANVYGNARQGKIDEDVEPQPVNHYGCSKLAMEKLVAQWFKSLPIILTRPFNYTGVAQPEHFLIPKIVSHFARRAYRIELGNLDVVRDFGDVRMVAEAYAELIGSVAESATVNICSGIGYSLDWVLRTCEELSGHSLEVAVNPAFVRSDEVKSLIGSNDRLTSIIGPVRFAGLRETLSWMLDTKQEPDA